MLLEGTAAWIVANDDGTGQFGDVWDAEWVRAAAASIDAVLESATNPGITPAELIDEVVEARGSLPSLDDRLDVALNDDGTLKTIAGQATNTDLQAILQARNVALNGNMEDWTLGGALAPDNFVLSGAAATIARTGPAMGDTFTFGAGTYAAKITRAGTNAKLLQSIISAGEMPAAADIKGKKIGVLVKGKTAIANHLRIIVDDGVLTSASSFHTGGGAAEDLTVVHTLSGAATKLEVYASVEGSNGDAYVGGWTFVFSNLAPSRWLPLDTTPLATASRAGLVSLVAQDIIGIKTFGSAPLFKPGSAATGRRVIGLIYSDSVQHANGTTVETDLSSHSLELNTLLAAGDAIEIEAWGTYAANANTKTVRMYFGGTSLLSTKMQTTGSGGDWRVKATVMRRTNTTQVANTWGQNDQAGTGTFRALATSPGETLSGAVTVKTTGQSGTASNDVIQEGFQIKVI
jgi:hypothetical protein